MNKSKIKNGIVKNEKMLSLSLNLIFLLLIADVWNAILLFLHDMDVFIHEVDTDVGTNFNIICCMN